MSFILHHLKKDIRCLRLLLLLWFLLLMVNSLVIRSGLDLSSQATKGLRSCPPRMCCSMSCNRYFKSSSSVSWCRPMLWRGQPPSG